MKEGLARSLLRKNRFFRAAQSFWPKVWQHHSFKIGFVLLSIFVVIAILAPELRPYSPYDIGLAHRLEPSSFQHWLGTDELGRDVLSRLMTGTRITFQIIISVSLLAGPLGLLIGLSAGYFGGLIDTILMRFTDLILSLPRFILAMALLGSLGPSIHNAILAISLSAWAPYARLIRVEAAMMRQQDYIVWARLQGASHVRILIKHILPMCLPTLLVRINLDMAGFILTAAGLGFLGLGAQAPSPEWGAMLASSRSFLLTHWWLIAYPGIALLLISMSFNLIGESLRDVFDPKQGTQSL